MPLFPPPGFVLPALLSGQKARLHIISRDGDVDQIIYETDSMLIEAPNWSRDGCHIFVNADGQMHRVAVQAPHIVTQPNYRGIGLVNNDHVISPDGATLFVSTYAGELYRVPIDGGTGVRCSHRHPGGDFLYFLHGIAPDAGTLACVGVGLPGAHRPKLTADIWTISLSDGAQRRLTEWTAPDDGPEFSPDGQWIYFNSERDAQRSGHAQIYRMRPDGTNVIRLTQDECVNWFPHISPDGCWMSYLSYPAGTEGHPSNLPVEVRVVAIDGGMPLTVARINGGQGTINVNSWSPDSRFLAYVDYVGA